MFCYTLLVEYRSAGEDPDAPSPFVPPIRGRGVSQLESQPFHSDRLRIPFLLPTMFSPSAPTQAAATSFRGSRNLLTGILIDTSSSAGCQAFLERLLDPDNSLSSL